MATPKLDRKSFLRTLAAAGAVAAIPAQQLLAAPSTIETKKRLLRVAHITDIHVQPGKVSEYGMAQAMHGVNDLTDKADFIITGGDSIMDACNTSKDRVKAMWQTFHSIWKGNNSLEAFHTIGNHDVFNLSKTTAGFAENKKWACDEFQIPKPYHFFDKGKWRFIILDSVHPKSIPGYIGRIDPEQLDWLRKTIADTPVDNYVCIVSHIPILAVCTMFDGAKNDKHRWGIRGSNLHIDALVLKDLFYQSKKVKACLSGHIHLVDQVDYLGTSYYCNGAVSGGWWGGNYHEFPPVFAVMNFYDDGSSSRELHYYKWQA